jgi:cytochrome c biogenesis protein CcdA
VVHTPPYAFSRQITGVADANLAQIRVRHDYLLIPPLPFISDPLGGGAASLGIAVEFAGTGSQVQLIAEVAVTNADASGYISSGVASTLADIVFAGSTEDEMLFETAATVATHNLTSGLVGTAFDTPPLDEVPTYYTLYWEMTTQADTLLRLFVGGYASTGVLGVGWTSCNLEFTVTKFVVRFLSP